MRKDGNRSSLAVIFACEFWQQYSKDNVALQQWVYSAMRSEYSTLWSCCRTLKCGGRKKGTGIYILLRTLNRFLHSCVPERFEDRFLIEIRASGMVWNLSVKHNKAFHFPWIAGKTPSYFLFVNYFSSPVIFFSSFMWRMGSPDNWLLPANWCISIGNHAAAEWCPLSLSETNIALPPWFPTTGDETRLRDSLIYKGGACPLRICQSSWSETEKRGNVEDAELIMTAVNSCWVHNDETKSGFASDWIGISAALERVSMGAPSSSFSLLAWFPACLFDAVSIFAAHFVFVLSAKQVQFVWLD